MGKRKIGKRKGKTNKAREMSKTRYKQRKVSEIYKSSQNWYQEEIKVLQISNEKFHGDSHCGLSYTELEELESLLRQGLRSVEEQRQKAEAELSASQATECEAMGMEWVDKNAEVDFAYQLTLSKRRRALRHKARQLRLSSRDSQQEHSPDPEYLMEVIEYLKIEKERLRLWNQRMIGKELDGMGCHELEAFSLEVNRGWMNVRQEMVRMKLTRQAQAEANGVKELISPGTDMITMAKLPRHLGSLGYN